MRMVSNSKGCGPVHRIPAYHKEPAFDFKLEVKVSPSFKVSNGVIQGDILFPRLFSVYIDDLGNILSISNISAAIYTQVVLTICFTLMIQCF